MDRSRLLGFDQLPPLNDGSLANPDTRLTKIGQKVDQTVHARIDEHRRSVDTDLPAK